MCGGVNGWSRSGRILNPCLPLPPPPPGPGSEVIRRSSCPLNVSQGQKMVGRAGLWDTEETCVWGGGQAGGSRAQHLVRGGQRCHRPRSGPLPPSGGHRAQCRQTASWKAQVLAAPVRFGGPCLFQKPNDTPQNKRRTIILKLCFWSCVLKKYGQTADTLSP